MPTKRTAKKTAGKCQGKTAKGNPCQRAPKGDTGFCAQHVGGNPMGGQPTAKTPAKMKALSEHITAGLSLRRAAGAMGVPVSTVHGWVEKEDSAGSRTYQKALAEREKKWLDALATDDKWQRWAWMLERTNAEDWADKTKQRIEHSGKDGAPLAISIVPRPEDNGKPGKNGDN